MLTLPVENTATPTQGDLSLPSSTSLHSLASGFGSKLLVLININWTNADEESHTQLIKRAGVGAKLLQISGMVF